MEKIFKGGINMENEIKKNVSVYPEETVYHAITGPQGLHRCIRTMKELMGCLELLIENRGDNGDTIFLDNAVWDIIKMNKGYNDNITTMLNLMKCMEFDNLGEIIESIDTNSWFSDYCKKLDQTQEYAGLADCIKGCVNISRNDTFVRHIFLIVTDSDHPNIWVRTKHVFSTKAPIESSQVEVELCQEGGDEVTIGSAMSDTNKWYIKNIYKFTNIKEEVRQNGRD